MLIPVFIKSNVFNGPLPRVVAVVDIPNDDLGEYADTDRPYRLHAIRDTHGYMAHDLEKIKATTTEVAIMRLVIHTVRKHIAGTSAPIFHYATIRRGDQHLIPHISTMTDLRENSDE